MRYIAENDRMEYVETLKRTNSVVTNKLSNLTSLLSGYFFKLSKNDGSLGRYYAGSSTNSLNPSLILIYFPYPSNFSRIHPSFGIADIVTNFTEQNVSSPLYKVATPI